VQTMGVSIGDIPNKKRSLPPKRLRWTFQKYHASMCRLQPKFALSFALSSQLRQSRVKSLQLIKNAHAPKNEAREELGAANYRFANYVII